MSQSNFELIKRLSPRVKSQQQECCSEELLDQAIHSGYPQALKTKQLLSNDDKIEAIASHFNSILEILGLDTEHPSIAKTPKRVAKMYVNEIFSGLNETTFPSISLATNPQNFEGPDKQQLIHVQDIRLQSTCEHHLVPILGSAHVAYVPRGKIIGLSKINRIVEYFAKRPQVQERLTAQIANCLSTLLESPDVAVCLEASHLCVTMRGIKDNQSSTRTQILLGCFQEENHYQNQLLKLWERK